MPNNVPDQKDRMRWIIFWVFLILFAITTVLTLLSLFAFIPAPDEDIKQNLYYVYIIELAIAISALFYSLFGLKKKDDQDQENEPNKEEEKANFPQKFPKIIKEITSEFSEDGLFTIYDIWRSKNDQIPAEYLFNIGIQRLLNAATLIYPGAISANFWVCQTLKEGVPSFFKSEQREGTFEFEQMVVSTDKGVRFRGKPINLSLTKINSLPVYARVVLTKQIELIGLETNNEKFDSTAEIQLGASHILGIPAINESLSDEKYYLNQPLAITLDLKLKEQNDQRLIKENAQDLQLALGRLTNFWFNNLKNTSKD